MDNGDLLKQRALYVGLACRTISHNSLWRWDDFRKSKGIYVDAYGDGGGFVGFRRHGEWYGFMAFGNIRLLDIADKEVSDPIPTGPSRIIDARSETISNNYRLTEEEREARKAGNTDIGVIERSYRANFSDHKLSTVSESFEAGFKEAFKLTIGTGDASPVKAEAEISTEFSQTLSNATGSEEGSSVERESAYSIRVQPESDVKVWAQRAVQPQKVTLSGSGEIDHSITIGKMKWKVRELLVLKNKFNNPSKVIEHINNGRAYARKDGKGKRTYDRFARWDSFQDFMLVIKRESPRDYPFAEHFRENPVPDWIIKALEEPLENSFRQDVQYDAVTEEILKYGKA